MFSDSKRARMKKKTERRENRSTNTMMQGCRKIIKKNNGLRMNLEPSLDSKQSETKKEQTNKTTAPKAGNHFSELLQFKLFFWGSVNDPFTKKKSPNSVEKNTVY